MKELAEAVDICMFCTQLGKAPFEARPMSTQQVDDDGSIWFLSNAESNKNFDISQDDQVQLLYADRNSSEYLSIYGRADVLRDKQKLDEVWSNMAKAWFTEGKNDPHVTLIRVRPEQAYYWDTKHGRVVSMLKIVTAMVTGKSMDDSIEGKLRP